MDSIISTPRPLFTQRLPAQRILVDNLLLDQAVARIVSWCDEPGPRQVCFVNAHCVNEACRIPAYREVLRSADLVLADGSGLKLAGRLLDRPIRDNVNGTDLFPRLIDRLAGRRVYLLGARPGVASRVARWIRRRQPSVVVCGTRHGYFDDRDEEQLVEAIAASRPDVLLVAMGVPRQDLWIAEHLDQLGAQVSIGMGGLFDFYSGRIPRAPRWMRELGMEWVYRLAQEPGRMWRRYLPGNAVFLARIARESVLGPRVRDDEGGG